MIKLCPRCHTSKGVDEFYTNPKKHLGRFCYCKSCCSELKKIYYQKNKAVLKEKARNYHTANRDRCNARALAWYQANPEAQAIRQSGVLPQSVTPRPDVCEVCKSRSSKSLHLDHDHSTMKFRGWLCQPCNHALGNAKDSPEILKALILYLEKQQQ